MNIRKSVFFLATIFFMSSGFAADKPTIVLVHGAFQDSKGWGFVEGRLKAQGFKVETVNLPGRDGDTTPLDKINGNLYRDKILEVIRAEAKPVILVGHSFGGIQISNVAEAAPEKIKALVYLSAYLPKDGESLLSLANQDKDSLLGKPGNLIIPADHSYASISDAAKAPVFANDASEEQSKIIVGSMIKEPLAPMGTPVKVTAAKFGKVKKFYIETTEDKCVSPYLQEMMIKNTKVTKVVRVKAGHASFVTQPDQITKAIIEFAK